MSVDVLREVFRLSKSRGVARNVLTVLSDAAHPDGVTWMPIVPAKDGDPTKCITHRANASKRAVIDALATLEATGEVEIRRAQRGRRRINVYRVVVGAIGATSVDYSDLPFPLEQPFGDGVQNLHLVTSGAGDSTECSPGSDEVQFSSPRGADLVSDAVPESPAGAGDSPRSALPEASKEPPREAAEDLKTFTKTHIVAPEIKVGEEDDPAAEDLPPTDTEIREAARRLRDADAGSPRVVIREAHGLTGREFRELVARTHRRRGGVGLLVALLRIARAERAAVASEQLAHGRSDRVFAPAPWLPSELRRDDPERYVRLMAPVAGDADLSQVLAEHHDSDRLAELLELAARVRAGDEQPAERETPEQARRRWITAKAGEAEFPLDEVHVVVDAWEDVADVERETLHELAEQIRRDHNHEGEVAA